LLVRGLRRSKVYVDLLQQACKKYFPGVRVHEPAIVADVSKKIDDVLAAVHGIFEHCEEETQGQLRPRDVITDSARIASRSY